MKKPRIVILGGGFGGVYTAQKLQPCWPRGEKFDVTLISRSAHFEFKPLFPEVFAGRLSAEAARFRLRDVCRDCRVKIAQVTGIDPKRRVVETDGGGVGYDFLVISLGGTAESVPPGRNSPLSYFESLEDCLRLRDRISELTAQAKRSRKRGGRAAHSIAIIGAGATGVELACEMWHLLGDRRDHGARIPERKPADISLIESAPEILPGWGQELRTETERILKQTGIRLLTDTKVSRIERGRVHLKGRRSIRADVVVWAGGLKGLALYRSLGVPLDEKGRFRVNSKLQLPRYKDVYAMGDAINTDAFAMPVPQSAQAAFQQAGLVAANIRNSIENRPLEEFRYSERGLAMPVGGRRAVARFGRVTIGGYAAWTLEKALFLLRIPRLANKLKLFDGLVVEPLVERGITYLEERGIEYPETSQ